MDGQPKDEPTSTLRNAAKNGNHLKHARETTGYLEISDYAIIGNLRTAAMVSRDASIDSFCFPYFDSPSVFARLLDKDIGGHFSIQPLGEQTHSKQQYLPNSAIISTKFLCDAGVCTVTDYMPRPSPNARGDKPLLPWLVRSVEVIRGTLDFRMECFPAFDYARMEHTTDIVDDTNCAKTAAGNHRQKAIFTSKLMKLELRAFTGCNPDVGACSVESVPDLDLRPDTTSWPRHKGPGVSCLFTLNEGETAHFILRQDPAEAELVSAPPPSLSNAVRSDRAPIVEREGKDGINIKTAKFDLAQYDPLLNEKLVQSLQDSTVAYWYSWIQQSKYHGRWREFVHRSAITLKLLTFELTGAIVAAATFSLPESLGGEGRNWDYRFSWIRDASFTVYALIRLGFVSEATAFMDFISARTAKSRKDKPLQILFPIRDETELVEVELDHLEGYKGQKPVRIGNGAAGHVQLDVYGELMDAVYLTNKLARPTSWEDWKGVRDMMDFVVANHDQPDASIWEVRGMSQNYLYSKIMMWVALDRGLRLADKRSFPCPKRAEWLATRDLIYEQVMEKGWNEEKGHFGQSYENTEALDASVMVMPLVFFIAPTDPRFLSTMQQILKPPERGGLTANNLVYRYDVSKSQDGVGGEEGAFVMCASWTIEALTRAGQYDKKLLSRARVMFEDLMGYANHVGLFSEEISKSGEALGNIPQAFSSISMISAAFNLDRVLSAKPVGE